MARRYHVCKETVRKWILKFDKAFVRKKLVSCKERETILLDETDVKQSGRMKHAAACLDLEKREVVSTQCSKICLNAIHN